MESRAPLAVSIAVVALAWLGLAGPSTPQPIPSPELLTLAKSVYDKQCVACHGAGGRGDGEAAYLLEVRPEE